MRRLILMLLFFISLTHAQTPLRDPFTLAPNTPDSIQKNNPEFSIQLPPLHEIWIPLFFSKANQIILFLSDKSNGFLSSRGQMHADEQSNQLWIRDDDTHISHLKKMIGHLDQLQPQFLIKAQIVMLDRQYQKALGIQFDTQNVNISSDGNSGINIPDGTDSNHPFTVTLAKLTQSQLLNLQLSALEQKGHAEVISNPSLITLNRKSASIESGAEVPYEEATASGATSVDFKKAVLRLKVTPQLIFDHRILLNITLNQDKVSTLTVKGVPAIQTQQMTTQVIAKNNQTIVLGGILEDTGAKQIQGIPILDQLPIIGGLFQRRHRLSEQQVLMIFLTPSIWVSDAA